MTPTERRPVLVVTVYRRYYELRKNLLRIHRCFQQELGLKPDVVVVWAAPEVGRTWLFRWLVSEGLVTHVVRRPEMVGTDGIRPTTHSECVNLRVGLSFVRDTYPAQDAYAVVQAADIWWKDGLAKFIHGHMSGAGVEGGAQRSEATLFHWDNPAVVRDIWHTNMFAVCLDERYWPPISTEDAQDVLERQWGRRLAELALPGLVKSHNGRERFFLHRHESETAPPLPLIPEKERGGFPLLTSGWAPWWERLAWWWGATCEGWKRWFSEPVWGED